MRKSALVALMLRPVSFAQGHLRHALGAEELLPGCLALLQKAVGTRHGHATVPSTEPEQAQLGLPKRFPEPWNVDASLYLGVPSTSQREDYIVRSAMTARSFYGSPYKLRR